MDGKFFKMFGLDGLVDSIQGYIDQKLSQIKLDVQQKLTKLLTILIIGAIILFLLLMMLAFLSLAIGFLLNDLLHSNYLGFLLMAIVFLFLILLIISLRKKIHHMIKRVTANVMSSNTDSISLNK